MTKFCCCCSVWWIVLKIITKKLQKLIIQDLLRELEVRRPIGYCYLAVMRIYSQPVVICLLNSLFILLEYFQKYLYLSTFKMSTFLLLLKYFFWSVLCTLLQVVFSSVTKLLLDYNFRVLFKSLDKEKQTQKTQGYVPAMRFINGGKSESDVQNWKVVKNCPVLV